MPPSSPFTKATRGPFEEILVLTSTFSAMPPVTSLSESIDVVYDVSVVKLSISVALGSLGSLSYSPSIPLRRKTANVVSSISMASLSMRWSPERMPKRVLSFTSTTSPKVRCTLPGSLNRSMSPVKPGPVPSAHSRGGWTSQSMPLLSRIPTTIPLRALMDSLTLSTALACSGDLPGSCPPARPASLASMWPKDPAP